MDPASVAAAAIIAAKPYIVTSGKEAAKGAAWGAGKSVSEWVKAKLTSQTGKDAIRDLESGPDDTANQMALQAALMKLLRSDPSVLSELAQLLDEPGATTATANIVGSQNFVAQGSGSRITRSISRDKAL
jgi:hypothetical protein